MSPPPHMPPPTWAGETVSVEQLRLSWVAGEVASRTQSRPVVSQWEEGKEDRHTVAKATTFEWVCSGNVARWWLYNRLKGGVWLWRGSDKASSGEAVEFFFSVALYLFISPSCAGQHEFCPSEIGEKVEIVALKSVLVFGILFTEYYVFNLLWAFSKRSWKSAGFLKSHAGWLQWLSARYLTPLWRSWSGLAIVRYTLRPKGNQISHSKRSGTFVRLSCGLWSVLLRKTSDSVLYIWEKRQ